jgi:dGTPase
MITAIVEYAGNCGEIKLTGPIGDATWELRSFMFEKVYLGSSAKKEEEKAIYCVKELFNYYIKQI